MGTVGRLSMIFLLFGPLVVANMGRTERVHRVLATLASALQRGYVPPERAAESAQRDLEALLAQPPSVP